MSNSDLIKRWFYELWGDGQLAVADEIMDDEYAPDWIQIEKKGAAQVQHEVRYFRSIFPDLTYEIIDSTEQDDKVWVRYKGRGTQNGAGWGFEPTGKQVEFEGVTIFTISPNNKICDRWGAFCMYDIFADLGLVPPFWELNK